MNLSLLVCLGLAGVLVVAVGVTVLALLRAPDGYEDDTGFHAERAAPTGVGAGGHSGRVGRGASPLVGSAARENTPEGKVAGGMVPVS